MDYGIHRSLALEIPSDEDEEHRGSKKNKRRRRSYGGEDEAPFLVLDATPLKQNTPSVSDFSDVSFVKCTTGPHSPNSRTLLSHDKFSGITSLIFLDSDNEYEAHQKEISKETQTTTAVFGVEANLELENKHRRSMSSHGKSSKGELIGHGSSKELGIERGVDEKNIVFLSEIPAISENKISFNIAKSRLVHGCNDATSENSLNMNLKLRESLDPLEPIASDCAEIKESPLPGVADFILIAEDSPVRSFHLSKEANVPQVDMGHEEESITLNQPFNIDKKQKDIKEINAEKKNRRKEEAARKKEEKARLNEERKLKRQEEKLQKEALKAEAVEMKKIQKEKQKWEKGRFALKSIEAEIDAKVVEMGSIGGHLLSRFAEKGLAFRITSNPIQRSILWKLNVPHHISQLSPRGSEVPYILFVYEAEEFCTLATNEALIDHVHQVQRHYPSYTICYITNRLMSFINKREQGKYKNPSNGASWKRPPVEEVFSRLTTHFARVHSRQCLDEAELAEHLVGLTSSLATCQFRQKMTRLSISANGSHIPKDFIDKKLLKKNMWLKVLIAIPKVQPRIAVAIWKKYPTMRSLLNAYLDPNKSVHEKESLLKDLAIEGLLGNENRRLGEVCSKRVYRILTAQSGTIKTDDVEDGADFFDH